MTESCLIARRVLGVSVLAVAMFGCHSPAQAGQPCAVTSDCDVGLICLATGTCFPNEPPVDAMDVTSDTQVRDVPVPPDVFDAMDVTEAGMLDVAHDTPPPIDANRSEAGPSDSGCSSAPPDAAVCASHALRPISAGMTQCGVLAGASSISSTRCQPETGGPEDLFALHLDAPTGVALRVDTPRVPDGGAPLDIVLSIRQSCSMPTSELACTETHGASNTTSLRAPLQAGDYVVIVDEFGTAAPGGSYQLSMTTFAPATNATCAGATMLAADATLSAQPIAQGDSSTRVCRSSDTGAALFYAVSIPAGHGASVTVTPHGPAWRAFVHAYAGCTTMPTCITDASGNMPGSPVQITLHNPGTAGMTAIVVVAAENEPTDPASTFDVTTTSLTM